MLSPSPVSLIQYAVLTWILWGYFSRAVNYKRLPRIMSFLDACFVVAFFVCITDAFWVSFTILKWLPLHPGDSLQIFSSLGRDIMGALLFYLFIGGYFRQHILKFDSPVKMWLLICFLSQAAWFWLAPSPAWTDYTFGWRHGADIGSIVGSWILSHFVMRIPLWVAILKTRIDLWC